MKKYKISVSKWGNKYSIVMEWENIDDLKEKVHKEWYSILNFEEFLETDMKWEKFIFVAESNGEIKKWAIIWDDIFKVYFKLRNWLKYNISEFYPEKDKSLDINEKQKILNSLKEQYDIAILKKEFNKEEEHKQNFDNKKKDEKIDNFYMKKELEESHKIIDLVLLKLKNILESTIYNISQEEREKYKLLLNNIIKLKSITNIPKIKEVWELALMKIWNLELKLIENDKSKSSELLLKDTNKLLKQIWSKNYLVPKNKDLKYILYKFYSEFISPIFKKDIQKEYIDENSYSYLKTKVLYEKYFNKLKENRIQIFKNIISVLFPFWYNKSVSEHLFLKRKVIKQNLVLLNLKITWKKFSYTEIINSYINKSNILKYIFLILWKIVFSVIFIYSITYIIYLNFLFYTKNINNINFDWIYYLLYLILILFVIRFSKWFFTFLLNSVIFYFIMIFFQINF